MKLLFLAALSVISAFGTSEAYAGAGWSSLAKRHKSEDVFPVTTVGARGGVHLQYISGDNPWSRKYDEGPVAGLFVSVHRNMFGGRVEGSVRQTEFSNTQHRIGISIINLDIPLLFEFRPIWFIKIHVGPQISLFPIVEDNAHKDARNRFKSVEPSAVFGVEGELPLNFVIGGRFIKGLYDINGAGYPGTWTTTSVQFYLGYHLPN